MTYLGIDPGRSGALALITEDGDLLTQRNTATEHDLYEWLLETKHEHGHPALAIIERVHSMPKQGVSSTFKFGRSYGFLRCLLVCMQIPFESVTPGVWQREFGLIRRKGETDTAKKNRHKAEAQRLFPEVKQVHATSDATLIAEYARRLGARRGM